MSDRRQKPKRRRVLQTSCSYRDADAIQARADRAGLSVSTFLRCAALEAAPPPAARRPSVNAKAAAQVLGALGAFTGAVNKIGSNVNQFTREVHRGREPQVDAFLATWEEFKALFDRDMAELRFLCLQALGRGPERGHPRDPYPAPDDDDE